jgi:hypothetical protein
MGESHIKHKPTDVFGLKKALTFPNEYCLRHHESLFSLIPIWERQEAGENPFQQLPASAALAFFRLLRQS